MLEKEEDKGPESIQYGKYKDSYSILKNGCVDISHLKRIRKNQDKLEILLGTQTMIDKIDKDLLFEIVG